MRRDARRKCNNFENDRVAYYRARDVRRRTGMFWKLSNNVCLKNRRRAGNRVGVFHPVFYGCLFINTCLYRFQADNHLMFCESDLIKSHLTSNRDG